MSLSRADASTSTSTRDQRKHRNRHKYRVVENEAVTNAPEQFSVGRFDPKDTDVATGMAGAPACGDVMRLQLKLDEDERIIDVKFKTYGCGSAIASSTLFVELLTGKTIDEAKQIKDKEIAKALELPPIKLHCSVLAEAGIKKALEHIKKNHLDSDLFVISGDITHFGSEGAYKIFLDIVKEADICLFYNV